MDIVKWRDSGLIEKQGEKLVEELLYLVYPRRCPVCHQIVEPKGEVICGGCRKRLQPILEPCCKKCGKPVEREEQEYCYDCAKWKHCFEEGRALYVYDKVMKKSIAYFKFQNRREYAKAYAEEICRCLGEKILQWGADCFVPVPIYRKKRIERGFNQAEVLAEEVSKRVGIPVDKEILVRIRRTLPQKELNEEERRKNLINAFQIGKKGVKYKKIILVDDIYTTGSTIDACTKVLKASGVQKVYFLSLCIGIGYKL